MKNNFVKALHDFASEEKTKEWAIKEYGNFARMIYGEKQVEDCKCKSCSKEDN